MGSGQFLYGRLAEMTIGIPGQEGLLLRSFSFDDRGNFIDGLRFKFNIEKNSDSTPNKAKIMIYNLSPDNRAALENKNTTVTLKAGYGLILDRNSSTIGTIFIGSGLKSFTTKEGPDYVTHIETDDGNEAYTEADINMSFGEGVKASSIIDTLASSMGIGKGDTSGIPDNLGYIGGFSASGLSRDVMDDVVDKADAEWSIQDGQLQILPVGGANREEAVLLASALGPDRVNTGIVGSPTRSGFKGSANKKENGIEFTSLLQPDIRPGRRVKVESKEVNGFFVCRKVTHDGDTRTGPWHSKGEATPL